MFSSGDPEEIKFLVNFYSRRAVEKNLPLEIVQALLKPVDKPKQETTENDLVKEASDARLEKLEQARLDSSCKNDEPVFVELEEQTPKKSTLKEWIGKKKRGFCKAFHRLCCCFRNKSLVS